MNQIVPKTFFKKKILLANFLILCGLCIFGNAFSRDNWNQDLTHIIYNHDERSVYMNFRFFDYHFGPFDENGFLRWCDFEYSADGKNYKYLMRAETEDQKMGTRSWLWMKYKTTGAQIQFLNCDNMPTGLMWPDYVFIKVDVVNFIENDSYLGIIPIQTNLAHFAVKWFLDTPSQEFINAKYIRLKGFWKVNGVYKGDEINVVYELPVKQAENLQNAPSVLNSEANNAVSENNAKVYSEADAIVIKGAELGKTINVYNTSGVEVKSVVTNSDVIKLTVPKNQVYNVNIGRARYKVAL